MTDVQVLAKQWADPDGAQLRCEQQAEIAIRYGTDESEPGVKPSAADVAVFVVAYVGGKPVGCGALRQLKADPADVGSAPGDAEIKRMFVRSSSRGSGVSVAILKALEARAVELGWTNLVLETGPGQPDAIRFYEREGYVRIPNFGSYRGHKTSWCFGRTLAGEPTAPAARAS